MSLKSNVAFVLVICLSYEVILSSSQVVLVTRNVMDNFRVGQEGCVTNNSVCNGGATCNTTDGLCYCNKSRPSFRNPGIYNNSGKYVYSDSYGCLSDASIIQGVGNVTVCKFSPFQLLPFSSNEEEVVFPYEISGTTFDKCFLENVRVKYPNNNTEMQLSYLNASYLELNASDNTLYFKWKKSVPELRGTIVTVNMNCSKNSSYSNECFQAKVFGTWKSDSNSSTTKGTMPSSSSTNTPSSDESSSNDDSNTTVIIVAVVVSVVLLILLIALIWCLCKRRNRNGNDVVLKSFKKRNLDEDQAPDKEAPYAAANPGYVQPELAPELAPDPVLEPRRYRAPNGDIYTLPTKSTRF